jgi:hypothetical protein
MIATLVVEYADGTTQAFASDTSWKSAIHAADGWQQRLFDDSSWKTAAEWTQQSGPMNAPLGHPWIPDSVKELRHAFDVAKPVKSARLYATAMGEYEIFLNGKRVGEEIMAPGWTDYRERVMYQTYDVTALLAAGKNAIGALLAPGWYETLWRYTSGAARATPHRAYRRQRGMGVNKRRLAGETIVHPARGVVRRRDAGCADEADGMGYGAFRCQRMEQGDRN